jgi:hypothetical protein
LAEPVNRDDVWKVEFRECPCLTVETLGERRISRRFGRQNLHGHQSIQGGLAGLVHRTHAALAEKL